MLLTASEIVQKSWDDYKAHWHDWMFFSLLNLAPAIILMVSGSFALYLNVIFPETITVSSIIVLLFVIASLFFSLWTALALRHATGGLIRNGIINHWKEHYAATLKYIWPSIYTSIFAGLIVLLGFILLFIPGIIFSLWFTFILYALVLDDKRGFAALKAGKELVTGRWWATWWRLLVPGFIFGIIAAIFSSGLSTLAGALPLSEVTTKIITNIIDGILSSVFLPLTTLAAVHLYQSLLTNPITPTPTAPPVP